jgi:glyoxylase-like metal-dependent hydrolase (beta-lactamase superfamily II)
VASAGTERIADDLHRLSVPYPAGYVNVYLVLGADGARLIDAGHHSEPSRTELRRHLAGLGVAVRDLREILLTHAHPDHLGSAAELAAESGAVVRIHGAELLPDRPALRPRFEPAWLRRHGLPESAGVPRDDRAPVPADVVRLAGDETLRFGPLELRLVHTPGHSPGLLCLHEPARRLLFATDQLLRVPTPLFLLEDGPGDPVGAYLDGLARLDGLAADLVLPGHGRTYPGLETQLARTRRMLRVRQADVRDAVPPGGATAYEVCRRLGWAEDVPPARRGVAEAFALGRLLAHLRRLEVTGEACFDGLAGRWLRTT